LVLKNLSYFVYLKRQDEMYGGGGGAAGFINKAGVKGKSKLWPLGKEERRSGKEMPVFRRNMLRLSSKFAVGQLNVVAKGR
jgi:hypothetical protein